VDYALQLNEDTNLERISLSSSSYFTAIGTHRDFTHTICHFAMDLSGPPIGTCFCLFRILMPWDSSRISNPDLKPIGLFVAVVSIRLVFQLFYIL
jgi:hypothetical protein